MDIYGYPWMSIENVHGYLWTFVDICDVQSGCNILTSMDNHGRRCMNDGCVTGAKQTMLSLPFQPSAPRASHLSNEQAVHGHKWQALAWAPTRRWPWMPVMQKPEMPETPGTHIFRFTSGGRIRLQQNSGTYKDMYVRYPWILHGYPRKSMGIHNECAQTNVNECTSSTL